MSENPQEFTDHPKLTGAYGTPNKVQQKWLADVMEYVNEAAPDLAEYFIGGRPSGGAR